MALVSAWPLASAPIACRGQDDEVDLAAAGLVPDLRHHRQRAAGAAADHQPATSPRDVLGGRQWGVPVLAAELPRRGLLALADLPAVDDQVVIISHAVNPDGTEGVAGESHADAPYLAPGSYGRDRRAVQLRQRSDRPGAITGRGPSF